MQQKLNNNLFTINDDGTISYTGKLVNRKTVGALGNFTTLKAAVDWFNASATSDTEILIDGGHFPIADTVTVNNATYALQIRGLGSGITYLDAATGLANKPMMVFKTACDINKITLDGSTLAGYGVVGNTLENGIDIDAGNAVYHEITDIIFIGFNKCIYDTAGADIYVFNFLIQDCTVCGIRINTANSNQYLDCEVGTFLNCALGVCLLQANTGGFFINTCFFQNSANQIGVNYTGGTGNYVYTGICNISDCTFNNVGSLVSGFSFNGSVSPIDRDKNIVIINNPGYEDKNPHAKVGLLNNATVTAVTTSGVFYKAAGFLATTRLTFNNAATAGTFTFTVGNQTTGNINYNDSAATIKAAIEALSNVTTVTVTQITASQDWTIRFDTAGEGWIQQSCNISGLTTTTAVYVKAGSYQCKWTITDNRTLYQPNNLRDVEMWVSCNVVSSQNGRKVDIAIVKNGDIKQGLFGQMTVYCATNTQPYPISTPIYIPDVVAGDYFELWVTQDASGQTVIVQDLSWLLESK